MKKRILAIIFCFLTFSAVDAMAMERILSFHSEIRIFPNSEIHITETIKVRAEGRNIRRGIFRDFPTEYKDRLGNHYRVGLEVVSAKREGVTEAFHTEQQANGVRIYLGDKNYFLSPGEYTYTLDYITTRQLGFFKDHDELYWNVTGNRWNFEIEQASASIPLPGSVSRDQLTLDGYTGPLGATDKNYESSIASNGGVQFNTTRPLRPGEGMTIVVAWPKGLVTPPPMTQQIRDVLLENKALLFGVVGILVLLIFYYFVWRSVGKDHPTGLIIPHYTPPKGYSPAAMRFINRMAYDHKAFATALVNLAVKGVIKIHEQTGTYEIERISEPMDVKLAAGEHALLKYLLPETGRIELGNENHETISEAIKAHKKSLRRNYEKTYFVTNSGVIATGLFITLLALVGIVIGMENNEERGSVLILAMVLAFVILPIYKASHRTIQRWLNANRILKFIISALSPIVAGALLLILAAVVLALFTQISISLITLLLLLALINYLFYDWMKAPTRAGRKLMDKMAGFQLYLEIAEQDDLNLKNPPGKTPALFEAYLPYAMALDVEQAWAEQFSELFRGMAESGQTYQPRWYDGDNWDGFHATWVASSLSDSLSSAISSSTTAPGSVSGIGGGFSGGGGGGGGGGGW